MLEFLPDGVEVLLFSGNQIPVLDWNLFGIWDEHPKLEVTLACMLASLLYNLFTLTVG